eukprot:364553-Chlamydomonas_euryale.AAC.5
MHAVGQPQSKSHRGDLCLSGAWAGGDCGRATHVRACTYVWPLARPCKQKLTTEAGCTQLPVAAGRGRVACGLCGGEGAVGGRRRLEGAKSYQCWSSGSGESAQDRALGLSVWNLRATAFRNGPDMPITPIPPLNQPRTSFAVQTGLP